MLSPDSSGQQRILIITAHTCIGLGLLFLHVYHISSVFENATNFSRLTRLERQMLFRDEGALYYYFYQTIAEAKDFPTGLHNIFYNNYTEYPNTINAIERFNVLPEIVIAYFYKQFIFLTNYYNIPTISCWQISDEDELIFRNYDYDRQPNVICEGPGIPMFFYLEVVWYLGGLSIFTLYMFATFLSRHILGGFCAVIYYFSIHKDATRLQTNPTSRDNFAFPFIFGQMYFLSAWIEAHNRHYANETNQNGGTEAQKFDEKVKIVQPHFSKLTLLTLFASVSWNFSTYIFVSQTVIIFFMSELNLIKRKNLLAFNYISAHLLADTILNILKYGTLNFYNQNPSFHCLLLITFMMYISQKHSPPKQPQPQPHHQQQQQPYKQRTTERIIMKILLYSMAIITIMEMFKEKYLFYHYTDIILTKLHLKLPTFSTILHLCKSEYGFIDWQTLNVYNCLFVSKFVVVFLITWSANWIHKRRQIKENESDRVQRAKNYLLEDYLEENKLSMIELANIERNKEIQKCMVLLKRVNYDYDVYKHERRKLLTTEVNKGASEKANFLNEVKKFKHEISEKDKSGEQQQQQKPSHQERKSQQSDEETNSDETKNQSTDDLHDLFGSNETPKTNKIDGNEERLAPDWCNLFVIEKPHYFFNIMLTAVLMIHTILILKIKYILTPVLCLVASTFPLKNWIPKSYGLWTVYLIIMASCVADRGLQNIKEQYSMKGNNDTKTKELDDNIYDMLSWITANTDGNAIFAGPEDIITTVLLATGRPIVNHPLNEDPEMRKRTRLVHTILSKQSANDVYNQLSMLRVDYIILSYKECFGTTSNGSCKISEIWDLAEPENQNNIPICAELFQRTNSNFLRVFVNENFLILKIFERFKIDLNLLQVTLQEKSI